MRFKARNLPVRLVLSLVSPALPDSPETLCTSQFEALALILLRMEGHRCGYEKIWKDIVEILSIPAECYIRAPNQHCSKHIFV